ncbi:MAG TPA: aminotransferase class I/II-fold pyridoxal phosphate-dependent enzyme [Candidatus Limnocylindrales bacterium]|nr:aminotransferase class I/II-fold pyridoxal phosphate-dependent enzyme [Candidatus Limnocylindrales bacterium]
MAQGNQPGRGFSTRAIRAATGGPPPDQRSTATPIYQSATFSTADADELGDVLTGARPGFAYSRIDNPTAAAMAAAVAELEGAPAGYAFGTGMAAIHAAATSVVGAGDHIVTSKALYGSVTILFDRVLRRFGVETSFVDATDTDAVEAAFRPNTRLLYLETIANPTIVVADLAELIERAQRRGITVAVDNTFASPYLCRPFELGADLVIESCTKWIGGHSDVMAGTVSCGPELIGPLREVAIETGGIVAPFSAFLVLRGLETLAVRMERHSHAAMTLARMLEARPDVRRVWYPGLPSHPQAGVAQRLLRSGGGMLAFDLGSRAAAAACIDALTLPERTASLGSVHTMAVHPPSTSHRQLDDAELEAAGIPPGMVRVSVGLEDVEDLVADFTAALDAAASAIPA